VELHQALPIGINVIINSNQLSARDILVPLVGRTECYVFCPNALDLPTLTATRLGIIDIIKLISYLSDHLTYFFHPFHFAALQGMKRNLQIEKSSHKLPLNVGNVKYCK
jgi:hypothetical protein